MFVNTKARGAGSTTVLVEDVGRLTGQGTVALLFCEKAFGSEGTPHGLLAATQCHANRLVALRSGFAVDEN
ncbi:MAG: hypothetical protein AAB663_02790 [Patescibacteria group bacterium]